MPHPLLCKSRCLIMMKRQCCSNAVCLVTVSNISSKAAPRHRMNMVLRRKEASCRLTAMRRGTPLPRFRMHQINAHQAARVFRQSIRARHYSYNTGNARTSLTIIQTLLTQIQGICRFSDFSTIGRGREQYRDIAHRYEFHSACNCR